MVYIVLSFYIFVLYNNTDRRSGSCDVFSGEDNGLAFELRVGLISLGISLCNILSTITGWLSFHSFPFHLFYHEMEWHSLVYFVY